jgi:hypothetical protein
MDENDPVNRQFQSLGYVPDYPPETIRGVHLTPEQYDDYVRVAGRLSKIQLDSLVNAPQWNAIPDESKLSLMKATIQKGRDIAQNQIMMKSLGSENDIIRKATDAKAAKLAALEMRPSDAS